MILNYEQQCDRLSYSVVNFTVADQLHLIFQMGKLDSQKVWMTLSEQSHKKKNMQDHNAKCSKHTLPFGRSWGTSETIVWLEDSLVTAAGRLLLALLDMSKTDLGLQVKERKNTSLTIPRNWLCFLYFHTTNTCPCIALNINLNQEFIKYKSPLGKSLPLFLELNNQETIFFHLIFFILKFYALCSFTNFHFMSNIARH